MMGGDADYLDKVLEGRSDGEKVKVLDMTTRLGIQRDDPLWLMMIAINHLRVVTEDLPTELQEFEGYLDQWSETNLKILEALASKAETVENLATSSLELTTVLHALIDTSAELAKNIKSSNKRWKRSVAGLEMKLATIEELLIRNNKPQGLDFQDNLKTSLNSFTSQIESQVNSLKQTGTNGSVNGLLVIVLVLLLGGFGWLGVQYQKQAAVLQEIGQKTQWLLEKQNREDCAEGRGGKENCL